MGKFQPKIPHALASAHRPKHNTVIINKVFFIINLPFRVNKTSVLCFFVGLHHKDYDVPLPTHWSTPHHPPTTYYVHYLLRPLPTTSTTDYAHYRLRPLLLAVANSISDSTGFLKISTCACISSIEGISNGVEQG